MAILAMPRATEACLCVGALTGCCDGADAGRQIVVEAELVLPIAIGDPEVDDVRVCLAGKGLLASNVTPADVYFGREETILAERNRIKLVIIANRRSQH